MVNVVANNTGNDLKLLTQTPKSSKKEQDFGTFLQQSANSKTQETKNTVKSTDKNSESEKMTTVSQKDDVADDNTYKNETAATDKQPDENNKTVQKEKDSKPDTAMEKNMTTEQEEISEEVVEVISQTVAELFENVAEILEVSVDELQELMEKLDLQAVDLLNPDSMVGLALAAEGEDSVIGIVMNENIYDNLHDLVEAVNTKSEELMQETELTKEELGDVLKKLEQMLSEEDENVVIAEKQPDTITQLQTETLKTTEKGQPVEKVQVNDSIQTTEEENVQIIQKTDNDQKGTEGQKEDRNNHSMEYTNPVIQLVKEANTENVSQALKATVASNPDVPDTDHILRQIADFVKLETGKEMTQMELQLHPASLGTINIQLTTKGGVVTAHMTTQNQMVKDVIESQVVSLKNNLEEQGVKVDAIEVSVASHQMEKNLEQGKQGKQEPREKKTEGVRKIRRTNINLNEWAQEESEDNLEVSEMEAVRIAKEMLERSGNTMDLLA